MKVSRSSLITICLLLWAVYLGLVLRLLPHLWMGRILALTSVLLVSHVIYAGYFLLSQLPRIDAQEVVLATLIGFLMLDAPLALGNFPRLLITFWLLFVAALLLHWHVLKLNLNQNLNHLARYKIRLELGIMAFIVLQLGLYWLFSSYGGWIAALGLAVLLASNCIVIFKHRIYRSNRSS